MDSAQAPLMADHQQGGEDLDDTVTGTAYRGRLAKGAGENPGMLVIALTVAAGISGLLFGCEFCLKPYG